MMGSFSLAVKSKKLLGRELSFTLQRSDNGVYEIN
jgi:hypothetical protein